jgi:hypothetical protein
VEAEKAERFSATGLPKRVTSTGFLVLRTSSHTDKHVALNFEIAICSTPEQRESQRPWSKSDRLLRVSL